MKLIPPKYHQAIKNGLFRKNYFRSSETVNFFLPFALLLLRTLRPFTVDILSRKPCLFFLFLTDG